jgi:hypothetical protein
MTVHISHLWTLNKHYAPLLNWTCGLSWGLWQLSRYGIGFQQRTHALSVLYFNVRITEDELELGQFFSPNLIGFALLIINTYLLHTHLYLALDKFDSLHQVVRYHIFRL